MSNPIIAARLEFLSTAIAEITAMYVADRMDSSDALEAVSQALEAFLEPETSDVSTHTPLSAG